MSIGYLKPGAYMSQGTTFGQMAFLAGQVAEDTALDITGQTKQVLDQIDALLAEAGTDKSRLLSAQIFLRDIGDWAAMNAVWSKWIAGHKAPARATVEAKLAGPGYLIEIVIVAAR
jgi:enamine deaminase RidA (YjgF/YER057c/UK114 family)